MIQKDVLFRYTPAQIHLGQAQEIERVAEVTRIYEDPVRDIIVCRYNSMNTPEQTISLLKEGVDELRLYKLNHIAHDELFLTGLNEDLHTICLEIAGDDGWLQRNEERLRKLRTFILVQDEEGYEIKWL